MMRKISGVFLLLALLATSVQGFAQKGKSEVALGYGYFTFYSFVNNGRHYNGQLSNSSGATVATYRYYLTRDITLGIGVGYENVSIWGSFTTFSPEVTFAYLDTRQDRTRVKLYGAFSYGFSVFSDARVRNYGHVDESVFKPWAFQATPLGMRIGRKFAGFVEVGFGYKGIVHGGMALRFPRKVIHKESKAD